MLGGVLLSRTLAGAVPSALSGLASGFGMDTGRFPVAVTTETTRWAVLVTVISGAVIRLSVWPPADPHARVLACGACVGGWVGCGPYSGRSRFLTVLTPRVLPRSLSVWCVGGVVVCVGLLVPVSSQTVTGLPLLAYQPSSLLGAYQNTEVSCGDLILKMVSRLDAFSGYPSRT